MSVQAAAKVKSKTSWKEKLEKEQDVKVVDVPPKMVKTVGKGTMVIATPKIIYKLISKIPKGKITTVNLIREKLARLYETDTACPITTGIFLWIVANAVEE